MAKSTRKKATKKTAVKKKQTNDESNEEEPKPSCFIIMPITTPETCYQQYKEDRSHFKHVLDCLFVPAVEMAGFTPVLPESTGSEIIHADIIDKLTKCEMVLCDMSILNANVFFELGVRTSLNKPVALIVDDKTSTIPFDLQPAQRNSYKSALNIWENDTEIEKVANHLEETYKKAKGENSLWRIFKIQETAEFNTSDVTDDDRFQMLYQKIDSLQSSLKESKESKPKSASPKQYFMVRDKISQILSEHAEDKSIDEIAAILYQEFPEAAKWYPKKSIYNRISLQLKKERPEI